MEKQLKPAKNGKRSAISSPADTPSRQMSLHFVGIQHLAPAHKGIRAELNSVLHLFESTGPRGLRLPLDIFLHSPNKKYLDILPGFYKLQMSCLKKR